MLYFALSLYFCSSLTGCHWLAVEDFAHEQACLEAGNQWTADGGDLEILDWKCVVKVRRLDPRDHIG